MDAAAFFSFGCATRKQPWFSTVPLRVTAAAHAGRADGDYGRHQACSDIGGSALDVQAVAMVLELVTVRRLIDLARLPPLFRVHSCAYIFIRFRTVGLKSRHSPYSEWRTRAPWVFFQMVGIDRGTPVPPLRTCAISTCCEYKGRQCPCYHQCFVPGERDHINIHFFHVDRDHASGLRRIDDEDDVCSRKTPHSRSGCTVPMTLEPWLTISAFVFAGWPLTSSVR